MSSRDDDSQTSVTQVYDDETVADPDRPAPAPHEPEDDDDTLQLGEQVEHFRIKRFIGRGGMGSVYLARDSRLGRKVALKLVHPRRLETAGAKARFLEEARTTARFSHPNIVAIHAVGEHRGRPYLALEYLEGESLAKRLREGRAGPREAMRVGLAIASALAEAHRHGVLHRDLKPGNVMMPRDGRPRVVDFGLATMADQGAETTESLDDDSDRYPPAPGPHSHLSGTPAYMAPEQWGSGALTPAVDVWALGLICTEMITGTHPYKGIGGSPYALAMKVAEPEPVPLPEGLAEAPLQLRQLIQRCVDKDPTQRPTAREVEQQLQQMLAAGPLLTEDECPFRGLQPFGERHAGVFFGRDDELATFVERLREEPVLPIVGPSGAGKSSFVRGGVIPRLREQGDWLVLSMRPGARPFATLAARLASPDRTSWEASKAASAVSFSSRGSAPSGGEGSAAEGRRVAALGALLQQAPTALNLELQRLADAEHCRVLLFVDQLEELYALDCPGGERQAFMEAVCSAADDALAPVRVVFTLRDDFLGQAAEGPRAREALSRVSVLRSPGEHALREILTRPLDATDVRYDDEALVDEMIDAVRGEPASLPLLQFALRALWDARDREKRLLLRAAYEQMDGVGGALAAHADGVLQGLRPAQVRAARTMLLRLITPRGTRRLLRASAVLEGLGDDGREVLTLLIRARLLTARRTADHAEASPMVELAHESLIRSWRQLAHWIDDSAEELELLEEIGHAAQRWERRGRRPEEVWQGDALHDARRRLEAFSTPVPGPVAAFLDAGVAREAAHARRRRLWTIGSIAGSLAVAAVAVIAAVAFQQQAQEVNRQRGLSDARRAEALRDGALAALDRGDVLEARAKLRGSLQVEDSPVARALWWTLSQQPRRWSLDLQTQVNDLALAPDGSFVAAACLDRRVRLIDAQTRQVTMLEPMDESVWAVDLSRDGRLLAQGSRSGRIQVLALDTGEVVSEVFLGGGLYYMALGPDGRTVAAANPNYLAVWDLERPDEPWRQESAGGHWTGVALGRERVVCGGADGVTHVWRVGADDPPLRLVGSGKRVVGVDLDEDADRVVTASHDGTVGIWDLATGARRHRLPAADQYVEEVVLGADGAIVASAGSDRTVRVFDAESGAPIRVFDDLREEVWALSFGGGGTALAAAGTYQLVQLWDLRTEEERYPPASHDGSIATLAFGPDGRTFATAGLDGKLGWWDVATGAQIARSEGHEGGLYSVAWSHDGALVATGGWDATVRLWDTETRREQAVLTGHPGRVGGLEFTALGDQLYSADNSGTVIRWELEPRAREVAYYSEGGAVYGMALTAGGRELAITNHQGKLLLLDARTLTLKRHLAHETLANDVAASPDGERLVTGCANGEVTLFDRASGRARVLFEGEPSVFDVAFSPAGDTVAAALADGRLVVIGLDGTVILDIQSSPATLGAVAYRPDGRLVAASGVEAAIRAWRLDDGHPAWRGPLLEASPPRLLTHRGWVGLDETPAPLDPDAAAWLREVDRRAARASARERTGCLSTRDGHLQLWDLAGDRIVAEIDATPGPVLALPGACAALDGGRALWLTPDGAVRELAPAASALAPHGEGLLLAAGDRVLRLDAAGQPLDDLPGATGVTAAALDGATLVLGLPGGGLELHRTDGDGTPVARFEDVPPSDPRSVAFGPAETLVVGFAGGDVVLWSLADGHRLLRTQLHGPVIHLALEGDQLLAGTNTGDGLVLDLSLFETAYCDVMRAVWDDVPVGWRGGAAVEQAVPEDHECSVR